MRKKSLSTEFQILHGIPHLIHSEHYISCIPMLDKWYKLYCYTCCMVFTLFFLLLSFIKENINIFWFHKQFQTFWKLPYRIKTKKITAIKAMVISPQSCVPPCIFQKLVKTIKFAACMH